MLSTVEIKKVDAQGGPERALMFVVELTGQPSQPGLLIGMDAWLMANSTELLSSRSLLMALKSSDPQRRSTNSVPCLLGGSAGATAQLLIPVSDGVLRHLEARTDRQYVKLSLVVRAQFLDVPPEQQPGANPVSPRVVQGFRFSQDCATPVQVPQSEWVALLHKMGWSELSLFEVPTLPLRDDPNLATAIGRVREAEGRLRGGDYRGVIAKCRDALESAAKYEAAGDVSKGFDLLFKRAFKGDESKPPLVDKIVHALRDHANELGRHEQYPALPASRSEAEFCFATTVALFSMLSRRLVGEET